MDFKLRRKNITFTDSDGAIIGTAVVRQAGLIENQVMEDMVSLARDRNEQEAVEAQAAGRVLTERELKRQLFRLYFYPYLFALTEGDVPTEDEALEMPPEQANDWYLAAHEVQPKWFEAIDEVTRAMTSPDDPKSAAIMSANKDVVKKKGRRRAK